MKCRWWLCFPSRLFFFVEFVLLVSERETVIDGEAEYVSRLDPWTAYVRCVFVFRLFIYHVVRIFEKRIVGIQYEVPAIDSVCNLHIDLKIPRCVDRRCGIEIPAQTDAIHAGRESFIHKCRISARSHGVECEVFP